MNFCSVSATLILLFLNSLPIFANGIDSIGKAIEKNYYSFDISEWEMIIDECENKLIQEPNNEILNYYLAIANHTLGKIIYNPDPEKAEECFDKSIESFEKCIDLNYNVEYEVLLSSALGKKASLSTFTALYWGIRSKNALTNAYEKDTLNPKTLLIAAIHLMHIPAEYGGDKELSEELLNKALKLNDDFNDGLNWARDEEIYAYLAQLEILKQNKKKARSYMDKALELRPDYDFVLIDLEKQLSSF